MCRRANTNVVSVVEMAENLPSISCPSNKTILFLLSKLKGVDNHRV